LVNNQSRAHPWNSRPKASVSARSIRTIRLLMMITAKLVALITLSLLPLASVSAADPDQPEEIIVTGRVPGPPMWKVHSGEHVLWIFPYLTWVPRDIIWESDRV